MEYFAQTLPQNAPNQAPTTLNPQTGETTVNQELTPQNSISQFSLGSETSSSSFLNSSSQTGVQLTNATPQTLVAELDGQGSQANNPPFAGIMLVALIVVALVLVARKTYR